MTGKKLCSGNPQRRMPIDRKKVMLTFGPIARIQEVKCIYIYIFQIEDEQQHQKIMNKRASVATIVNYNSPRINIKDEHLLSPFLSLAIFLLSFSLSLAFISRDLKSRWHCSVCYIAKIASHRIRVSWLIALWSVMLLLLLLVPVLISLGAEQCAEQQQQMKRPIWKSCDSIKLQMKNLIANFFVRRKTCPWHQNLTRATEIKTTTTTKNIDFVDAIWQVWFMIECSFDFTRHFFSIHLSRLIRFWFMQRFCSNAWQPILILLKHSNWVGSFLGG